LDFDLGSVSSYENVTVELTLGKASQSSRVKDKLKETLDSLYMLPQRIRNSSILATEINENTILITEEFIERLYYLIISSALPWYSPHVTTEGEGEISLEWWQGNKVLTIFVDPSSEIEYLKACLGATY
jgi:hypothetical protein